MYVYVPETIRPGSAMECVNTRGLEARSLSLALSFSLLLRGYEGARKGGGGDGDGSGGDGKGVDFRSGMW